MRPDVLVLDECQFLKSRTAKRTRAVYGPQSGGDGLVQYAKRVWLLSGTPVPNNASELWPHFAALWPELIPVRVGGDRAQTWFEFISRYCFYRQHPQYGLQVTGNRNPEERRDLMQQFMLRRRPEEVLTDLPPISFGTAITLTASHHVAFVEASWTPADNLQAAKRCHRIGQSRPVIVRMFSLAGSIDEVVTRSLARKTQMISQLEA